MGNTEASVLRSLAILEQTAKSTKDTDRRRDRTKTCKLLCVGLVHFWRRCASLLFIETSKLRQLTVTDTDKTHLRLETLVNDLAKVDNIALYLGAAGPSPRAQSPPTAALATLCGGLSRTALPSAGDSKSKASKSLRKSLLKAARCNEDDATSSIDKVDHALEVPSGDS